MTAQAALALRASCRWAVTGTPVQNGLSDIFSLFRFIQVYPYSERSCFDEHIVTPWIKGCREDAINRLKRLLQYIMLRRHTSIITLPERTNTVYLLKFDEQERLRYQKSAQATIYCLDDLLSSNATLGGHRNVVAKINALRMACNLGCQQQSGPQGYSDPSNLISRSPSLFEVPEAEAEAMECSETASLIRICRACGVLVPSSQFLMPDQSGEGGPQHWCSTCLLDYADPVEEGSDSDVTSLDNTSIPAGVTEKKQWPTKIRTLLEDIQSLDPDIKWSVTSYPAKLPFHRCPDQTCFRED